MSSGIAFRQTFPACGVEHARTKTVEAATLSASTMPRSDDDDADRSQRRCGTDDDQCHKNHEGNEHATILQPFARTWNVGASEELSAHQL